MKLVIEEGDGGLNVGVPLQDTDVFDAFMLDTGVFFKDKGDDEYYLWYVADLDALPFLKQWNDEH